MQELEEVQSQSLSESSGEAVDFLLRENEKLNEDLLYEFVCPDDLPRLAHSTLVLDFLHERNHYCSLDIVF